MDKHFNVQLLSDEPCDVSQPIPQLGMEATAKVLSGIALGTPGPFTIGLYGDWGSGKTTVLNRAAVLCSDHGKEQVAVIRLNPWEHEREPNAAQTLLQELALELERLKTLPEFNWVEKAYINIKVMQDRVSSWMPSKLGWAMLAGGAKLAGADEAAIVASIGGVAVEDNSNKDAESDFQTWNSVREKLKNSVPGDCKVIVFLDDLDRCQAHRAMDVLEAVKHLLWVPGFVFVLALDERAIKHYLSSVYNQQYGDEGKELAKSYMQKIVQAQVPVAHRDAKLFRKFVDSIVQEAISANNDWIPDEAESGAVPALLSAAAESVPRQAKRLINNVLIDWATFAMTPGNELTLEDAAGIALSRIVFDLGSSREVDISIESNESFPLTTASLAAKLVLHSDNKHLLLADSLISGKSGSEQSPKDEEIRIDTGDWMLLGLGEAIKEPAFLPWLTNRQKRLVWCRFAAHAGGEAEKVFASEEQIHIVNQALRESLGISESDNLKLDHLVINKIVLEESVNDEAIAYLSSLNNIKISYLSVRNTQITDSSLVNISKINGISQLSLVGTKVTGLGLKNLEIMANLKKLWLTSSQVRDNDIRYIGHLKNLTTLWLSDTKITDACIENIGKLSRLDTLALSDTNITSLGIKKIATFVNLKELWLLGVEISDEDLSAIEKLTNLKELWLDPHISEKSRESLRAKLPLCEIN
ncbi:MAG: hypothetical protein KF824_07185 [Fimbriimonadaceae bacterium]|nr:MAG: hypothetical protein KF824_07185 [Fimbriimonadaceae bacterium]